MYDELTQVDIDKMKAELEHRRLELRPKLIEDVQTARAFGDLSENYEYKVRLVTTLRQNALEGLISKESPVGKAILGKKVGDRVEIVVSPEMKYTVEIRSITPGEDDASLEISSY